ncbi:hypothetical protein EV182_001853 [Spiromyces aspiralis]|uniref:Uncharacterized protein n=1 Tax=Spiromyces aspiralis TaxID=68401 RepID=A0ACC1HFL4_9FUNG|nr:hypothetical protein EV182_001853 [Spiromyces aspiralis]
MALDSLVEHMHGDQPPLLAPTDRGETHCHNVQLPSALMTLMASSGGDNTPNALFESTMGGMPHAGELGLAIHGPAGTIAASAATTGVAMDISISGTKPGITRFVNSFVPNSHPCQLLSCEVSAHAALQQQQQQQHRVAMSDSNKLDLPSWWGRAEAEFVADLCSSRTMPTDSLMIWRARIGALKVPEPTSPEQTCEFGAFGAAMGAQLGRSSISCNAQPPP